MAASKNDKLMKVGLATATNLDANYTAGATSLTVVSTSGMPTDTGITVAIDTIDSAGVQVPGSYNEYVCTVASATGLANVEWADGSGDTNYNAGATTRVYIPVAKTRENRIVEWGINEHNQDGTHSDITATSVTASGAVQGSSVVSTGDIQVRSTSIETIRSETEFDYVASGGVWSGDAYASTRNASMTAVTCYINGRRGTIAAVTSRSFTASKDTYVDILNDSGTFSLVYTEVTNNAASPALAANSVRLAIIVTGASNIANVGSVNQGEENKVLPIASSIAYTTTDSLGNLICPRDPNRRTLGYKQITSNVSAVASSVTQATGLTCPTIVPTGRKVKVTVFAPRVGNNVANTNNYLSIWLGAVSSGSQIAESFTTQPAGFTNIEQFFVVEGLYSLTSGSLTFNAGYTNSGGGSTTTIKSTTNGPTFIRVELV